MIYQLTVPEGIEDVDEIRVLAWSKAEQERVAKGDLLVELETHKALVAVRAEKDAFLRSIMTKAGEWRAPGQPLAALSDAAEEPMPDSVAACTMFPTDVEIDR